MSKPAHLQLVANGTSPCSECRLRAKCLPDHFDDALASSISDAVRAHPPAARGTWLFRQGEPMTAYYFLRSGSAKSVLTADDGHESVMSFLLPTDLIGAASLEQATYQDSVITLERSSVCEVPARALDAIVGKDESVRHLLLSKVVHSINAERHARVRLEHLGADARMADFILEMSARLQDIGRHPDEILLAMSRYDIASYLGLASETVSRALTRFGEAGLVSVQQKQLTIVDRDGLLRLARGESAGD